MKVAADTRDDVLRTLRGHTSPLHGTPVHVGLGLLTLPACELCRELATAMQSRHPGLWDVLLHGVVVASTKQSRHPRLWDALLHGVVAPAT
jgi:hypothetical protein